MKANATTARVKYRINTPVVKVHRHGWFSTAFNSGHSAICFPLYHEWRKQKSFLCRVNNF